MQQNIDNIAHVSVMLRQVIDSDCIKQVMSRMVVVGAGSPPATVPNILEALAGIRRGMEADRDDLRNFLYTPLWLVPTSAEWMQRFRNATLGPAPALVDTSAMGVALMLAREGPVRFQGV